MTIPVESLREIGGNRGRGKSRTDGTFSDICLTRLVWLIMIGDFQRRETSRLSPGSRRWKPGKREEFEVVSGSLTAFVKKLKRRPGKDIYLGGGGELCRSFLREDLIDELYIGVGPMLLGDGIPGFPGKFPQRDFRLTECKSYSNGSVGLRYERMRTKTSR